MRCAKAGPLDQQCNTPHAAGSKYEHVSIREGKLSRR
jgi:hypothetical protein